MNHYCRYCTHCNGYEEEHGYCDKRNETVGIKSVRNACTDFEFCEIDAFYFNRSDNPEDAVYKPRQPKKRQQCDGQINLEV